MKFEDFIKKGHVRRTVADPSLVRALYKITINDLKYLNAQEVNELSARKLVVSYYDSLRSILEAISVLDGYKIYQHEAFTYFLREKGEEINSIKFDRFRKIRNKLNYYGEGISVEEAKEVIQDIKRLIDYLIKMYLKIIS